MHLDQDVVGPGRGLGDVLDDDVGGTGRGDYLYGAHAPTLAVAHFGLTMWFISKCIGSV